MGIDLFPERDVPFNRSVARKILTARRRAMTTRCRGKEQPENAGDYLCQLNGMEVDRHKGHYKSVMESFIKVFCPLAGTQKSLEVLPLNGRDQF